MPQDVTDQPEIERAGRPRRVLVVEDNDDIRDTLRELLEELGHCVSTARDGLEGLRRIREERPEVALIDIGLPGLTGYEVAQRVRDDEIEGKLPPVFLVALTGYGQPEDRERAQLAGFSAHMVKPPDVAELLRILDRA